MWALSKRSKQTSPSTRALHIHTRVSATQNGNKHPQPNSRRLNRIWPINQATSTWKAVWINLGLAVLHKKVSYPILVLGAFLFITYSKRETLKSEVVPWARKWRSRFKLLIPAPFVGTYSSLSSVSTRVTPPEASDEIYNQMIKLFTPMPIAGSILIGHLQKTMLNNSYRYEAAVRRIREDWVLKAR